MYAQNAKIILVLATQVNLLELVCLEIIVILAYYPSSSQNFCCFFNYVTKKMYEMKKIVLYTTDDCPYCNIAESILKTVLDEYDGLFEYKSVKINKKESHRLSSVPTIFVGKVRIEGLPEKEQIHSALFS